MSYQMSEPDKAKTDSDSIFDSRFNQIFNENIDIDNVINVVKLYGIIENLREEHIADYGTSYESGGQSQYLVYGHWFILFTCKLLWTKSRKLHFPVNSDAEALVQEAIGVVSRACSQSKAVAHYQMFRSARTKEKIYTEIMGKQLDLFEIIS